MKIIGVSGMPGSGKSFISEIAAEKGSIIISMGDIIREEAKKRGESSKETAVNIRKEFGENIVSELTIKKIKKLIEEGHDKPIIIEGIRSLQEVDMFKKSFDNFIILSVFANENLRFERLKKRMREDDSTDYNVFQKRDRTELGFGLGNVISLSDRIIINESDLDSYKEKIRETLEEINL